MCQILTLAASLNSFAQAAKALSVTDGLEISPRHVSRLAREVGLEMAHESGWTTRVTVSRVCR